MLFGCSPEKEILLTINEEPVNPVVGYYAFDLSVGYGTIQPDINAYLPPKKFETEILKSESPREVSFLNIHDTGMCIYAKVSGSSIDIPLQDLRLMPEVFGFSMAPDNTGASVHIVGSGRLTEINRTADEPTDWEMEIEYQLIYQEEIIWTTTGKAKRFSLSAPTNFTCD